MSNLKIGDKLQFKHCKTGELLNFVIKEEKSMYYQYSISPDSQFCKDVGDCDNCKYRWAFDCKSFFSCTIVFKTFEDLEKWVKENEGK